jgi:hypothetical protein
MRHDYALLCSMFLCLSLVGCAGDDDDMGATPTSVGDTEVGDDTTAEPTTDAPTTGPTTDEPSDDAGDDTGDDMGDDTGDDMGDDTSDDGSGALGFNTHVWPIIDASCSCHKSDNPQGGLDLRALAAYNSLVGTPSVHDPDTLRVAPGNPDESFLLWKLTGTQPDGHGNSMPPAGSLPAASIDTIEQWIEEGAEP